MKSSTSSINSQIEAHANNASKTIVDDIKQINNVTNSQSDPIIIDDDNNIQNIHSMRIIIRDELQAKLSSELMDDNKYLKNNRDRGNKDYSSGNKYRDNQHKSEERPSRWSSNRNQSESKTTMINLEDYQPILSRNAHMKGFDETQSVNGDYKRYNERFTTKQSYKIFKNVNVNNIPFNMNICHKTDGACQLSQKK